MALSLLLISSLASATCYRISFNRPITNNPTNGYYIEPGKGTFGIWHGATDTGGSIGNMPNIININNDSFQPPGTLLAAGTINFMEARSQADAKNYSPEQILYRCTADEKNSLKEMYATNGDFRWGGMYLANQALNLPDVYLTAMDGLGVRLKNLSTGEYYSKFWKGRALTDVDTDSYGWLLVKAKNFSNTGIEVFKINGYSTGQRPPHNNTGAYPFAQPSGYIAFKSKRTSINVTEGADSQYFYNGFYASWPVSFNLYRRLKVRRSATCQVMNTTPYIHFPVSSVPQLQRGQKITMPIHVDFSCQSGSPANNKLSGMTSGTASGQTAIGFLPDQSNVNTAMKEGLTTAGTGVTYLLSNNYGNPEVASGVGVKFYKTSDGSALNFLSTLSNTGSGANAGWYPILDDAKLINENNGLSNYTRQFNASFEKLPKKSVTPGTYNAKVQVIIQVQ